MVDGRVRACTTHHDLLEQDAEYAALVAAGSDTIKLKWTESEAS